MMPDDTDSLREEVNRLKDLLEYERRRNEILLQSMVDGVYTTDVDKTITFWNDAAERITGFTREEAMGSSCRNLLCHTDDANTCLCDASCPLSASMSSDVSITGKEVYTNTTGGIRLPVSVSCSPIKDDNGEITGAIEVFRDISEKKRLDEYKSRFFKMVTHDLKSPLTSIIGYTDLLLEELGEDRAGDERGYLKTIKDSARKMADMVSDFLNLTKMDSPTVALRKVPFALGELVDNLVWSFKPFADSKDINLSVVDCSEVPVVVMDPHMLERAITNLLSNALKFTGDGGEVSISISHAPKPDGKKSAGSVIIAVRDTGCGIHETDLDKVFDMYFRSADSSSIEGNGLGLALVKSVAEAHGGHVTVESRIGEGSTFAMTLPLSESSETEHSGEE